MQIIECKNSVSRQWMILSKAWREKLPLAGRGFAILGFAMLIGIGAFNSAFPHHSHEKQKMIVSAWTNGRTAFGLKVREPDRDEYFSKKWASVLIDLPNGNVAEANVAKESFWGGYRELISFAIREWLEETGSIPWKTGKPPKFVLTHVESNRFRIDGPA
ncbi:MAG: hypothetical protein OD918_00750 [Gammaproteobacteria bacterium]